MTWFEDKASKERISWIKWASCQMTRILDSNCFIIAVLPLSGVILFNPTFSCTLDRPYCFHWHLCQLLSTLLTNPTSSCHFWPIPPVLLGTHVFFFLPTADTLDQSYQLPGTLLTKFNQLPGTLLSRSE